MSLTDEINNFRLCKWCHLNSLPDLSLHFTLLSTEAVRKVSGVLSQRTLFMRITVFIIKIKFLAVNIREENRHGKINEEIQLNFTSPITNSNPKAWPNHAWSKCNFCLLQGNAGYNSEKWESLKRRYIFYCFLISIGHFCWIGKRMSHRSKGKWKKTACYGKFSAAEIFHVYAVSAVPCHYCVVL